MILANVKHIAREAGLDLFSDDVYYASPDELARFATLIEAAERERCAKVAESFGFDGMGCLHALHAAAAIRSTKE